MVKIFGEDFAGYEDDLESLYEELNKQFQGGYYGDQPIKELITPELYDLIVVAQHSEGYESSSWILVRDKRDGKLYENSGGHCSCMGYEDQWAPEETNIDYLVSENAYFMYPYNEDVRTFLRQANCLVPV